MKIYITLVTLFFSLSILNAQIITYSLSVMGTSVCVNAESTGDESTCFGGGDVVLVISDPALVSAISNADITNSVSTWGIQTSSVISMPVGGEGWIQFNAPEVIDFGNLNDFSAPLTLFCIELGETGECPDNGAVTISIMDPMTDTGISALATHSFGLGPNGGCIPFTALGDTDIGPSTTNTVSIPCSDLPVELTAFNAESKGDAIALNWTSATELNFDGYQLERSLNGVDFEKLAWIQGAENSIEERKYNYLDIAVKGGITYYYRLKMIDLDEAFQYSPVRSAQINGKREAIEIFPNPTSEAISVTIDVPNDDRVNIRFYDATGKVAFERVQDLNEGNNALEFDLTGLPTGLYRIVVAGSQIRATESVVVMD